MLDPVVAKRAGSFLEDVVSSCGGNLHSMHVVGSAVTSDFDPNASDINSLVVLKDMDLGFIESLAPLGRKYGARGVAAPVIMTPRYIADSLDAFPVEFLDFKLIHKTVYGEDILAGISLDKGHLRLQCEREVKVSLVGLRQGYLMSLGKRKSVMGLLSRSITSCMPVFRAIVYLHGSEPPVGRADVIQALSGKADIEPFKDALRIKIGSLKPDERALKDIFESYYRAIESLGAMINDLRV